MQALERHAPAKKVVLRSKFARGVLRTARRVNIAYEHGPTGWDGIWQQQRIYLHAQKENSCCFISYHQFLGTRRCPVSNRPEDGSKLIDCYIEINEHHILKSHFVAFNEPSLFLNRLTRERWRIQGRSHENISRSFSFAIPANARCVITCSRAEHHNFSTIASCFQTRVYCNMKKPRKQAKGVRWM
jgi:hypothetical protein